MKNLKQVVANVLLVAFAVMMLGFGAGYYLAGLGGGVGGYKFLDTLQNSLKIANTAKAEVYVYISGMIMVLVFVSLLIALALLSLLCNFKVIKNEKVNKLLSVLKLFVVVFSFLSFVLILASTLKMVDGSRLSVGYGLIVNVILSILSICVVIFAMIKIPKKKK